MVRLGRGMGGPRGRFPGLSRSAARGGTERRWHGLEGLEPRLLLSADPLQVVSGMLSADALLEGESVSLEAVYTTQNPEDETLTGLGLRMHFDSSELSFDGLSGVLADSKVVEDTVPQSDSEDRDNDAATDKYVQVAWSDITGNWPGEGQTPTSLYTAQFTAESGFTGTTLRFSATSTAGEYELAANPVTLSLRDDIAPTVGVQEVVTRDTTPRLTGMVDDPLASVEVSVAGQGPIEATNHGDGTWSLADDVLAELGDGVYDVQATATDGSGNTGGDRTSGELTVDTAAPVVGVDDLLTNDPRPALSGTVDDAEATVEVSVDGQGPLEATNHGDGTWTLAEDALRSLDEGVYDVQATATDGAGNVGQDKSAAELTVDTTPPAVTVDDLLTNDPTPALSGTVDGASATIEVSVAEQGPLEATNHGDGTWTLAEDALSGLSDGTHDVQVTATDGAGNEATDGTSGELAVDTTPPAVTVDELLTNDPTPALSGTVDDPEATIEVSVDGQGPLAATNHGDGTWTLADDALAELNDGSHDVEVSATDGAGNVGADGSAAELAVDTAAPVVAVDDFLTNDPTPKLSGTVGDPTATIEVSVAGQGPLEATNHGDGTWTLTDNDLVALADGVHDVQVTATDGAGNVGQDKSAAELTVDTTPPVVTVDELLTGDPSPGLSGTVDDPTATVTVTVGGQGPFEATNHGDGTWTLADDALLPLADFSYDVNALATDGAGNTGADGTTDELTIETTPPAVTVDELLTNDPTPALSGTVDDESATVEVTVAGQGPVAATNHGDGTWTLADDALDGLTDGTHDVQVTATDAAGNEGKDGSADELTVDTTAPVLTVDTLATDDPTPALSGTVDDASVTVKVTVDGQGPLEATNHGNGTWSLADGVLSALADGTYDVQVSATDTVGNTGTDATGGELTVDTSVPVVTVDELLTNDPTPALSGTVDDASATVTVEVDGQGPVAATNHGDGTWTLADDALSGLADGTHNVEVTATDGAGNTGMDDSSDELTIETVSPVVTVEELLTSDSTPALSGTVDDASATVTVEVDGQGPVGATNHGDGTWTLADDALAALSDGRYDVQATATDAAGNTGTDDTLGELTVDTVAGLTEVEARHLFYNGSAFDGKDSAANAADDRAIASDVEALMPGETADGSNISNEIGGITGVMIDITGLADPDGLSAADFELRMGNSDNPTTWGGAPSPDSVTVRPGAGVEGSDRVTLTWEARAIRNTWLQIAVKANDRTGLAADDVFYFGNQAGDVNGDGRVNATDNSAVRANMRGLSDPAGADFPYDLNRDGRVNATDVSALWSNLSGLDQTLRRFEPGLELSGDNSAEADGVRIAGPASGSGWAGGSSGTEMDALAVASTRQQIGAGLWSSGALLEDAGRRPGTAFGGESGSGEGRLKSVAGRVWAAWQDVDGGQDGDTGVSSIL